MSKKFLAAILTAGLAINLCACGSSSGSSSTATYAPAMEETPAEAMSTDAADDEAASSEKVYDEGYYSADELIDMLSWGEITIEDIEFMTATGEVGCKTYEEVLSIYEAIKPTTNFWDYPELNNVTRDMIIKNAISFSDGAAWITVDAKNGRNAHAMLINTSGEVLCHYNTENMYWDAVKYSFFSQGVSILENKTTDEAFLINTSGDVVWSKEKGISDIEAIYGIGSVESLEITCHNNEHFNGYFLEKVHVNTFEKTCNLYAVIKPDGTWLFEPLENNEIRLGKCYCWYSDTDKNPNRDYIYVNLFSGETLSVEHILKNGVKIVSEGEKAVAKWEEEYDRANQDGLIYNNELQGFTDSSGNIVIDCSGYILDSYYSPKFYNGYCVLAIKNPDGADYITVIDTDGNQLFAPIKNNTTARYGFVSDGYFVMTYGGDFDPLYYQFRQGGEDCYITLEGEVYEAKGRIYESEHGYIYPFSDGYSLVCPNSYYDEYMFVDTNFNDAFPQSSDGQNSGNGQAIEKNYITMNNFSIEGKWKSIGSYGFGQAQPGAVVAFDGTNCNFFSPSDTYAFYMLGDDYRLECTGFMSTDTASFTVKIIDADHIDVYYGDHITELQRTQ